MSYYYRFLFENYKRRFKIIIESYNPEAVEANCENFKNLAQNDGMKVIKIEKHDRPEFQQCSYYIYGEYEDNSWKVRDSDHEHNDNYDFENTYNLVSDIILSNDAIKNKYQEFKDIIDCDKSKIEDCINNTNFVIDFVNKYKGNPKEIIDLCNSEKYKEYNIDKRYIRTDWFKVLMQRKCEEISSKSSRFKQKYETTFLSNWKPGERLKHF